MIEINSGNPAFGRADASLVACDAATSQAATAALTHGCVIACTRRVAVLISF